jgi:TetR/AcrR family transcriptional regulator, tetracycline repressor protein
MLPCTSYSCQVASSRTSGSKAAGAGQGTPADVGERTRLTRAAVTERALALADESGLEALTIRRLATELGVTPMALYWHFRGKEELFDGVVERVWSEIDISVDPAAPWTDQLRALVTSYVTVLRTHPAAAPLLARTEKMKGPAAIAAVEISLEVLRTAGFNPVDASMIARTALWTGIMLVMSEPGIEAIDEAERTELQRTKQVIMATLPQARYPRLVECAAPMTACDDPDRHYGFGLEMFMAGVTALAAARAAQPAG